jgi:hypothetical protein
LSFGDNTSNGKCTENIAVGSAPFIQNVKALIGGMALGRKVLESEESFQLKEVQYPYIAHFGAKKSDIGAENTYLWNKIAKNASP